ncbi:feline leukemia virus subgroup C receptor-related protein 2-like isoform X1 [Eriocheir sinensis]|uniref:feline leukemia virus subgroup C receptor-related protein 2-like isoform X1 n=2 Tax=Eriocheir sinensis TaxID=95602 RepID=UPI0021C99E75|nr:feline leukemia virus subgroup C receptor-related protein 2-like isoform X1 [Eriocheir sinensis]XP_050697474.1 feline leukemia virus subgroup C receptor-related protein 2-like isoform X1 [Eriocheir sinensis]XP_050697475.1 feline leukemia virus subgroup C receptor-related protein 2-like isoform X1 [Eriocheir sinensis]
MSDSIANGGGMGGEDLKLRLTSSDTITTLVSPTTPPSDAHCPLVSDSPPSGTMGSITKSIGAGGGIGDLAASTRDGEMAVSAGIVRVDPLRWVMLFLFVLYSMSNAFQWIQYSIIANVIVDYYDGVSTTQVDWLSMIYMVTYIPLIFPASWYLEKQGLRRAVLIGSFGTMVGSWVKVGSVSPDRFFVTFAGQVITAVSQVFILGVPPRLAAVWFGPTQVSTACAIGVFGNQLGVALGFLVPPAIVPTTDDQDLVGKRLFSMFLGVACFTTALFIAILIVFKEKPQYPPSAAALAQEETSSYVKGVVRLVRNPGYVLLLLSYGINVGAFYAISTLLNQVVLKHFPGESENAGRIGLLIVLAGMLGSVVCGFCLDKTAKFKLVTLVVYLLSTLFMLGYTFIFHLNTLWMVFVMAAMLGFFMTGYLPVGFEFAAELTYPEPEGTSSGLLNASAQFFGVLCTMADGQLLAGYGDMAANLLLVAVLVVGCIMTASIKEDLRRQAAHGRAAAGGENGTRM